MSISTNAYAHGRPSPGKQRERQRRQQEYGLIWPLKLLYISLIFHHETKLYHEMLSSIATCIYKTVDFISIQEKPAKCT